MKNILKILCLYGLQLLFSGCNALAVGIDTLEYPDDGRQLRISFDETVSPQYRLFVLDNPIRLVIDLKNTALAGTLEQPFEHHPLLAKIRAAVRNHQDLRLVVDLNPSVDRHNLLYNATVADRQLRIDFADKQATKEERAESQPATSPANALVIAIDAGHGGNDPGAQGVNGGQEKNITLAIAKKLSALLNRQQGIKAVLVREGDYFIALRKRMEIAREADADLFVSIHADANPNVSVSGASVYTLSKNGASSEAAHWLAEKENNADLVGGITLNDEDDDLASVLLDLSQDTTLEHSYMVANEVLKSFGKVSPLHKDSVQKAGFIVLKSPDIPSILVETAFISNPAEERNLLSEHYQDKMAEAISKGVLNYLKQTSPVDSKIAGL